jgi:hypothetical protein
MSTICIAVLTLKSSTFCPENVFCVSYDSQNKQVICLNSINRLVFVIEMQCVFYKVRTGFLNIVLLYCTIITVFQAYLGKQPVGCRDW